VAKVLVSKESNGRSIGKHLLHNHNDKGLLFRLRFVAINSLGCVLLVLREDE
jgi:hypothetical protein